MTVNTTDITSGPYTGNGVGSQFSYDFRVDAKSQLKVFETDDAGNETTLVVDTDYTVNNIGTDGGGTIDRIAGALPLNYIWYIRADYKTTQDTDFDSQGAFFPDVHESAIDKLTFLTQQLYDLVARSFRLSDGYSGNMSLILPEPEAGKLVKINGTATSLEYTDLSEYGVGASFQHERFISTAGQTVFNLVNTYVLGVNTISVYVNGLRQAKSADYTETANNVITFISGLNLNDEVDFVIGATVTTTAGQSSAISYISDKPGAVTSNVENKLREVVSVKDFGAKGDGVTDDTAAIELAIGATKGAGIGSSLYFPQGTYLFSETTPNFGLYINDSVKIFGDGTNKTILKNTSATGAGLRCAGSYITISDLTIDQNGSSGIGYRHGGQHSHTTNIAIINQTSGTDYACVVDGTTLCNLTSVRISNCVNGISLAPSTPSQYIRFNDCSVEYLTGGRAVDINTSSNCVFNGLYIEPHNAVVSTDKAIDITGASEIEFINLGMEIFEPLTSVNNAWIEITDSSSVFINGVRINESGAASPGTSIFDLRGIANRNIVISDVEVRLTSTTIKVVQNSGTLYNLDISNINVNSVNSNTGINLVSAVNGKAFIKNWNNANAASSHALDAVSLIAVNIDGDISLTNRTDQLLINCTGVITGSGATTASLINSGNSVNPVEGGLVFPSTQVPNSNVNTLDDYEEGVWVPEFRDSAGNVLSGGDHAYQQGLYTKVGNCVTVIGGVSATTIASPLVGTNGLEIHGLPFASKNITGNHATVTVGIGESLALPAPYASVTGIQYANTNAITLQVWDSVAGVTLMLVNELSDAGELRFSYSYLTA